MKWYGGPWAHFYDLYHRHQLGVHGRRSAFADLAETSAKTETSTFSFTVPTRRAQPGTTYYWKVVGKTMALKTKTSAVWTFTTAGAPPPPPPATAATDWQRGNRALRVGGDADGGRVAGRVGRDRRRRREDAATRTPAPPKITTASATPANYFELTFNAEAGRGYRLWIRGKADSNNWANDSVFVQFTNSRDGHRRRRPGGSARPSPPR